MIRLTWKPHTHKRGIYTIYADEEPWKEIHASLFGRKPAIPKTFPNEEELEEWFSSEIAKKAKLYAFRRLSQQNYLSKQLRKTLTEHCVPQEVAANIVAACINDGYICDEDWIGGFIRRQLRKGDGPRLIIQKLRAKGIDNATATEALDEQDTDEEREERIRKLLEKSLKKYPRQKAIAAVIRKGYDFQEVYEKAEG